MDVKFMDIQQHAISLAEDYAKQHINKQESISADDIVSVQKENVLKSDIGFEIVKCLVMGAISEYHYQLRDKLLEQNIDIGDIDFNSSELQESYESLKKRNINVDDVGVD